MYSHDRIYTYSKAVVSLVSCIYTPLLFLCCVSLSLTYHMLRIIRSTLRVCVYNAPLVLDQLPYAAVILATLVVRFKRRIQKLYIYILLLVLVLVLGSTVDNYREHLVKTSREYCFVAEMLQIIARCVCADDCDVDVLLKDSPASLTLQFVHTFQH